MKITLLTVTAALVAAERNCLCEETNSCAVGSGCVLKYNSGRRRVVKRGWDKVPKAVKLPKVKPCAGCGTVEETQKVVYHIEPEFVDPKPQGYTVVTTERRKGKFVPGVVGESVELVSSEAKSDVSSMASESSNVKVTESATEYVAPTTLVETRGSSVKRGWVQTIKDKLRLSDRERITSSGCATPGCPGCVACGGAAAKTESVKHVTVKVPVETRTHISDRMRIRSVARKFASGKCEGTGCGFQVVTEAPPAVVAPVLSGVAPVESTTEAPLPNEVSETTAAPVNA